MQLQLFSAAAPSIDDRFAKLDRIQLDPHSWIDFAPRWMQRHDLVYEQLKQDIAWQQQRTMMYEREVDVPRLLGKLDDTLHPLISAAARALSLRYRRHLDAISLAYYRDGRDSVAMHGDKLERRDDSIVAVLSLGCERTFLVKPRAGGPSQRLRPGEGDLLVMGGRCQQDWLHGVPKATNVGPRIAVMFRETSGPLATVRPSVGRVHAPGHGPAAQRSLAS